MHLLSKLPARLRNFIMIKGGTSARDKIIKEQKQMDKCKDNCDELDLATLQNANADLKAKVDELTGQVKDLTTKLADSETKVKEAGDALGAYKEAEKKGLIDSITQRSQFKADDLKDRSVEDLRVIHLAIDKAKPPEGTVKNVRGADGAPTRPNMTADGRIDPTKSIMGVPKRNADGSVTWEIK